MNNQMISESKKAKFAPAVWLECLIFIVVLFVGQFLQIPLMIGLASSLPFMVPELVSTILSILVTVFYCRIIARRSYRSMGFTKEKAIRSYLDGVLLGIGLLFAIYAVLFIFGGFSKINVNGFSFTIVLLMIGFMIQSASEEILLRGYLMNSIAAKSNIPLGIILNSVLFMMIHLLNPSVNIIAMINLVIFGIIFSLIAIYYDNIWAASGMHFSWNFILGCILGGNVSGLTLESVLTVHLKGNELLTGGSFGIEGSIFLTIIGILVILVLNYLCKEKKRIA